MSTCVAAGSCRGMGMGQLASKHLLPKTLFHRKVLIQLLVNECLSWFLLLFLWISLDHSLEDSLTIQRIDITYSTGKRKMLTVNCRYKFGEWSYQKQYDMTAFLHRYVTFFSGLYWCANLILLLLCNTGKNSLLLVLRAENKVRSPHVRLVPSLLNYGVVIPLSSFFWSRGRSWLILFYLGSAIPVSKIVVSNPHLELAGGLGLPYNSQITWIWTHSVKIPGSTIPWKRFSNQQLLWTRGCCFWGGVACEVKATIFLSGIY